MDEWERRSGRPLRELPRGGDNHAFLLKALREASGEIENELYNLGAGQLSWHDGDEWSLVQIAGHLRDREDSNLSALRAIVSSRRPLLELVDFEAVVEEGAYKQGQLSELLYGFSELRQDALYLLYNLSDRQWRRIGVHRYRGDLRIEQLVKEMNEHDLAHLWQVMRLKQAMP